MDGTPKSETILHGRVRYKNGSFERETNDKRTL